MSLADPHVCYVRHVSELLLSRLQACGKNATRRGALLGGADRDVALRSRVA